jgi:hypothetical protein
MNGTVRTSISPHAVLLANYEIWVLALLVAGFWIVRWLAYGQLSRRTPIGWPIFLVTLTVPVILWRISYLEAAVLQVYPLVCGVAIFYAIVNWAVNETRLRWLLLGRVVLGLVHPAPIVGVIWGHVVAAQMIVTSAWSKSTDDGGKNAQ